MERLIIEVGVHIMVKINAVKYTLLKSILVTVLCGLLLSACVINPIKPWERGVLARDDMQLEYDEQIDAMDEQVYYSKEGAFGGRGIGGGGCGCN